MKLFTSLFTIAILLFTASPAAAQTSNQDWSNVETVANNTNLIVETKTGTTVKGKVASVTAATLNLSNGGKTIALERDNIARVYRAKKSSRLKRALIGAGIGAVAGFGIGGIYSAAAKEKGLAAAAGVLYGVPIGAVIGAATGGKNHKGNLIYESR